MGHPVWRQGFLGVEQPQYVLSWWQPIGIWAHRGLHWLILSSSSSPPPRSAFFNKRRETPLGLPSLRFCGSVRHVFPWAFLLSIALSLRRRRRQALLLHLRLRWLPLLGDPLHCSCLPNPHASWWPSERTSETDEKQKRLNARIFFQGIATQVYL